MRNLRQFWTHRRLHDDRVLLCRLGPLRLWLARGDSFWRFAHTFGESQELLDISAVPSDVVPDALEWTQAHFKQPPQELLLLPAIPDRPVVVQTPFPVVLPAGQSTRFLVRIPVSVEVRVETGKEQVRLGTLPSQSLSDTWFGTPTEGTFCYALSDPTSPDLENLRPGPHHIVVPVGLRNASSVPLEFGRFCLRLGHAGLYCGDRHLWSSPVEILQEDPYKPASLEYAKSPPGEEGDLLELVKPSARGETTLRRLTFGGGSREAIFEVSIR